MKSARLGAVGLNQRLKSSPSAGALEETILATSERDFNMVNCATAIRMLGVKRSRNRRAIDAVLKLAQHKEFDSRGLATCCYGIAVGKLLPQIPDFLLNKLARVDLEGFNSRDISSTIWSFAKLAQPLPPKVLRDISQTRDWQGFSPQSVGSLFRSLALLGNSLDRGVGHVQAQGSLQQYTTQSLCNILWAMAKAASTGKAKGELVEKVSQELATREHFNSQDMANTVWALSCLQQHQNSSAAPVLLLERFTKQIRTMDRSTFAPQELTSLMWGLATLQPQQRPPRELLGILESELCLRGVHTLAPQHLATLAWAFTKLDVSLVQFGKHVSRHGWRASGEWRAQDFSNLMWALAKNDLPLPYWLGAKLDELDSLGELSDQAMANILWAFAHGGAVHRHSGLLARFVRELEQRSMPVSVWVACVGAVCTLGEAAPGLLDRELDWDRLTVKELSMLTASFANVRHCNPRIIAQIANRAVALFLSPASGSGGVDPCLLLWGFACLGALDLPEVERFFALERADWAFSRTVQNAHQVTQAKLAWEQQHKSPSALLTAVCRPQDDGWPQALVQHRLTERIPSLTQVRMYRALAGHLDGLEHETSVCGLSVDMAIESARVVVEVDGPRHFLSDGVTFNGATALKRRILQGLGYRVYSIPVVPYQRLGGAQQAAYIDALSREIAQRGT